MPDIEPRVSDFRHRVALCTQYDVVENSSTMSLARESVSEVWAKIYALPHLPSFMSPYGFAVKERANRVTHWITLRYKLDLDFTSAAWVYEPRLKSPPRWYKVLGFYDSKLWITLHAHLVEKSTEVIPPRNQLAANPTEI